MEAIEALFNSGRVVDLALVVMALMTASVWVYRRATGRLVPIMDMAWTAGAGACLLLALRAALTEAAWPWVAVFMTAALIAYVGDIRRRLYTR